MRRLRVRGFNLLELLVALAIGLALIAAFLAVLQRSRRDFTANESLARLHDSARHAMAVLAADIEHAGFFGFSSPSALRLVRQGATLAEGEALSQPDESHPVPPVAGLPPGVHDCGENFALDLRVSVQASDNSYTLGTNAPDCEPTASADGARGSADTLTLRRASLALATPRAGRLQLYSSARTSAPLLLFADGRAPGPVDDEHEVRDLEVRSYYISNSSVERPGWPALRVKSLTESRGAAQFRDEEVMPGVEDLQVEFSLADEDAGGEPSFRHASVGPASDTEGRIVAVRIWLRIRADVTEPGHRDPRTLRYSNVSFTPTDPESRQRRLLVERTVALRNTGGS